MSSESNKAETIFGRAIAINDAAERAAFLKQACAGDESLRVQLEELVGNHFRAGGFLERPALPIGATLAEPAAELPGTQIGPYKLLQEIGEGGMGVVYMAEQSHPVERRVALKIIRPGMDSRNVVARFEAERQALALMDHPNIAKVFDAGTTVSGRPYFVMELVKGVPITTYCDKNHLTPAARLDLFLTVCQAVQHAHQKGIIHRDIKPSNVMVALYDGKPIAKVIDFGVAKATSGKLTERTLFTEFGQIIGTPEYMSPEQAQLNQLDIDTRTDIYSLGVLLYELLTGTTPLERKRLQSAAFDEMLRIIREEDPPRPSTRLSSTSELPSIAANRGLEPKKLGGVVQGDLDWIVMKALEKDRSRRYETPMGFAMDIQRYLANEPVLACPPSARYRFTRFARRNRILLVTVSLIAAALSVGIVASTWQAVRPRRAEHTAQLEQAQAETQRIQAEASAEQARAEQENTRRLLYRADMNLADRAWKEARVDQVAQLIERHADDRDLQGFEWHYQRRLLQNDLRTLVGHSDAVSSVSFSPDGARLASAGNDGTIRLWDGETGNELRTLLGNTKGILSASFSPDGRRLVSGGVDRTIKLWDVATGDVLRTLHGHSAPVQSVAFSPDGRQVASGSIDRAIKLWNSESGEVLQTLTGHRSFVWTLSFSPNGEWLASASEDGTIRLWDVATGRELRTLLGHNGPVQCVSFSADGVYLISGGVDRTVKLWDVKSGDVIRTMLGHTERVTTVAFRSDGRQLASAGADRTIRLWDAATGAELCAFKGHADIVSSLTFRADGRMLASASADHTIKLWDAETGGESRSLPAHANYVASLAYSPDGRRSASAGKDQNIKFWDTQSGNLLRTLSGQREVVVSLAFSADGRQLASGAGDGGIRLWDADTYTEQRTLDGHAFVVYGLAFRPDGRRLASASSDATIKIWDVDTGKLLNTLASHISFVWSVAFSPDSRWLASASLDGTVKLWNAETTSEVHTLQAHPNGVWSVSFSPDSRRLASAGVDAKIRLWNVESGEALRVLQGHTDAVVGVSFSPDGRRLVSAGDDGTIKLWDVESGDELRSLPVSAKGARGAAFNPTGQQLAAIGGDDTIKLWSTALESPDEKTSRFLVDGMFADLVVADDVLAAIAHSKSWTNSMRDLATKYAESRAQTLDEIYATALEQLSGPATNADSWSHAKRQATALNRRDPSSGRYARLLALAQSRAAAPAEALQILSEGDEDQIATRLVRNLVLVALEEKDAVAEATRTLESTASQTTGDADLEVAKLRLVLEQALDGARTRSVVADRNLE